MNITELHVDDFGAWHDLTLDELDKGATVFYGPNEAGKTTLLNMIRTVLYGFSEKRCSRYLPPARGNEAGGSLAVGDINGGYRLRRSASSKYRGGPGNLDILSDRGDKHGNEILTTLLSGVDETIFNNVFAVGLTQMQQLSTLSDTEAANQLYGLATGVDRVSLHEVARDLEVIRDDLLPPLHPSSSSRSPSLSSRSAKKQTGLGSQGRGSVDWLIAEKKRLQKELKALRRDEGHYAKLRREHQDLLGKIKEKENAKRLLDGNGEWRDLSSRLRKQWSQCLKINDALEDIGPIADVPKHINTRLTGMNDQVKNRRREWEQLRDERKRLKKRAQKHKGTDTLYQYAAEIEALGRQRPRIAALEEEVQRSKTQAEELEFEMNAEIEQLGLQTGTSAKQLPPISDQIIDALRVPAREARELRESVEALKKLGVEQRKEAERVKTQLETAAVRHGGKDIAKVLNNGVVRVNDLERRIDIDEHREGLVRRLDEVEDESKYWMSRTVLPWRGVLMVCGIFSGGVAMLLAGLLYDWFHLGESTRLPMMLIGGALSVVSLVIKGSFENSAKERAEFCRQQIDLLHDEQQRSQEEAEELDQSITSVNQTSGNGHYDQQLISARKELSDLQQFVPLAQQYETLVRESEATEHQTTIAVRQLKDARRGWKASLRTVGLPETLTPAQVGEMTGRVSDVTRLRNRANEAKRQLRDREQELATIKDRIEQLLILGQVDNIPDRLTPQLVRLTAELEKHSQTGKERVKWRTKFDELKVKQDRLAATAKQLRSSRQQLLHAHGLSNANDYRDTIRRGERAAKLRRKRDQMLRDISQYMEKDFTVNRLKKMLDKRSSALIEKISRLDRDHKTVGESLRELYERSGQLKQKLDGRMQDRRGERKELEIRVLDEKIRDASRQWHRSALMTAILDEVKKNYETKRQPVALAEASRHLERLTEGRYTRIWTPMGQNALCIDNSKGNPLPVDKLSRGTRELIFLSLRLALVSSYNRRGANMPMVLDDVFVNFDDQRARAAAKVLFDIANSGQQMLIFTCHERIRNIFLELNADVRDLPVRSGLSSRVTPLVAEPVRPAPVPVPPAPVEVPAVEPPVRIVETIIQPPPPAPEPEVVIIESELPVYDAASWDEAVEELSLPLAPIERKPSPVRTVTTDEVFRQVAVDLDDEPILKRGTTHANSQSHLLAEDQIEPEWRDEWLEPLPDLAD